MFDWEKYVEGKIEPDFPTCVRAGLVTVVSLVMIFGMLGLGLLESKQNFFSTPTWIKNIKHLKMGKWKVRA